MRKLLLFAPILAFATNGDNLIGAGAISRGLAGSGISSFIGAESIFLNPATLSQAKTRKIEGGLTLFMPNVHAKSGHSDGKWHKSEAPKEYIPYLGYLQPLQGGQAIGMGLFSVSGMGVKYPQELASMKTSFKYAKCAFAYALSKGNLRLGAAVHLALAKLEMDANLPNPRGGKESLDAGLGYQLGMLYHTGALQLGLTYTSKTPMSYKGVFDFNGDGQKDTFKLTQPSELGIGATYALGRTRFYLQWKRIAWSKARGYKEFGWKDQRILALAFEHRFPRIDLRGGLNFSSSPLGSFKDSQRAFFNIVGFPAISKRHYSLGLGYALDPKTKIELAYVYSPKERISSLGFEATNRQHSLSVGVSYVF